MVTRRQFLKQSAASAGLLRELLASPASPNPFFAPFFAMDTAMVKTFGALLDQSDLQLLMQLGYSGVAPIASSPETWNHLVRSDLSWCTQFHLRLYAVYSSIKVGSAGAVTDPGIAANLPALKDTATTIWLPVTSTEFKPSDLAADRLIVPAVRQIADLAARNGCFVALYPHFESVIERVDDAIRIARQCERPNVGVTFNLCHWLRTAGPQNGPENAAAQIKRALPVLSQVTINGANRDGSSWQELIQPLDQGTFNVKSFLKQLRDAGYHGPIGLQGYDVAKTFHLEPKENLQRSMAAWKAMNA